MATAVQIAANRRNALKSTGPRTPEGKAVSRFNALQHGLDAESILLPGEDPEACHRMVADYQAQFQPAFPLEEAHLATIIHPDWLRRRLRRTQGKLYRALLAEGATPDDLDVAIFRDSPTDKFLRCVTAEVASLERSYFRVINDLRLIRRADQQGNAAEIDMLVSPCTPGTTDGMGFVPGRLRITPRPECTAKRD
jgi:hypothetical protein